MDMCIALTLVILYLNGPIAQAACPSPCQCGEKEFACEHAELTSLPDGLESTTTDIALGHNAFTSLTVKQFSKYPDVRVLYLQNNAFTELDLETVNVIKGYPNLSAINLSNNPLDCSCSPGMEAFLRWLNKKQQEKLSATTSGFAIIDGYATLCHTPAKLRGQRLDRLKVKDVCSK